MTMKIHMLAAIAGAGVCALALAPARAGTTTTSTTTTHQDYEATTTAPDRTPRVRSGVGIDVIGAVGGTDESRLGIGGRLTFVTPFGLTLGGSLTQHFNTNSGDVTKTRVRPLLGEIGFAIPVTYNFEINPMVGIGYAWVNADTSSTNNGSGQATANVAASNFDIAPGVKLSYVGEGLEIFTMPKYHVIKDLNFFALEAGVGARF
jgi:hypothetical protein